MCCFAFAPGPFSRLARWLAPPVRVADTHIFGRRLLTAGPALPPVRPRVAGAAALPRLRLRGVQAAGGRPPADPSHGAAVPSVRTAGLVKDDWHLFKTTLRGQLANEDTWIADQTLDGSTSFQSSFS